MFTREFWQELTSHRKRTRRNGAFARGIGAASEVTEDRCLLSGMNILPSPVPENRSAPNQGTPTGVEPLSTLPQLNSLEGAPVSVILKFDGYTDSSQNWVSFRNRGTGPIVTPAFDLDGDALTFNDEERRQIEEIWSRVAEDYAPFNVNVTTIAPPNLMDFRDAMVVIGGSNDWAPTAGGWGQLNGFSTGGSNISYVFSELFFNTHQVTSATSHESGHTLGLNHQSTYDTAGNKTAEYNPGDAISGPIMGVGYDTVRDTWFTGTSTTSATTIQDDLASLTGTGNRTFSFRTDDHGDVFGQATVLDVTSPSVTASGILERNDDVDVFVFETNSGPISFSVNGLDVNTVYGLQGLTPGTNADLILRLYDANGILLAEDDPTGAFSASLSADVIAGTYYIEVSSTDQYGAIGQYTLDGTVVPLPTTPVLLGPSGIVTNGRPDFVWRPGANAASYDLEVSNLTTGDPLFYTQSVTGVTHTPTFTFPEADYQARVRTVAADGSISEWSNVVSFAVDIPAPVRPVITSPTAGVVTADAFPTFRWTSPGANSHQLWVGQIPADGGSGTASTVNNRVINLTDYNTNSYQHFLALQDGSYTAWVRSFNALGEASEWSQGVTFHVEVPTPAPPAIVTYLENDGLRPTLEWVTTGDAYVPGNTFHLWINNLSTGTTQVVNETALTEDSFTVTTALPQGRYGAWVRAISSVGEKSAWSQRFDFEIDITTPARPVLTGPVSATAATAADGSTLPDDSSTVTTDFPVFTWTEATGAVAYDLWVNHVDSGTSQIIRETGIEGTSFTSDLALPEGLLRAWVRGLNEAGEVGEWSVPYSFRIDVPTPTVLAIIAPVPTSGGAVETSTPTIKWTGIAGNASYNLQLRVQRTEELVLDEVGVTGLQFPVTDALEEQAYQARVQGVNSVGELGPWSEWYTFKVDVPNATTPEVFLPEGTVTRSQVTFQWQHTSSSVRYEILVRDLLRQESIVFQVKTIQIDQSTGRAIYTNSLDDGTYRFWVRAFNTQGTASGWSESKSFTVDTVAGVTRESGSELEIALTSLTARPELSTERVAANRVTQGPDVADVSDTQRVIADVTDVAEVEAVMAEFADPAASGLFAEEA